MNFRASLPESNLPLPPALRPWQSYLILFYLSVFICKMGIIIVILDRIFVNIIWDNTCTVPLCVCVSCSVVSDSATPGSLPGSSVLGILQARILEWVAIPFSRGSSQPRDQTQVFHIAGRFFIIWATREAPKQCLPYANCKCLAKKRNNCPLLTSDKWFLIERLVCYIYFLFSDLWIAFLWHFMMSFDQRIDST